MQTLLRQLRSSFRRDGTPLPDMAEDSMLELRGVTAKYGATVAIREVDISIKRGEVVALLGANGAGKSTTLNTVAGLVAASEGVVGLKGRDITTLAPERVTDLGVSLTPEGRQVFGGLTVQENLRMGAGLAPGSVYEERLADMLELFPVLEDKFDRFAGLLSGGEQQMLAIARSLMSDPEMLLLDEPSLGLAPVIVTRVFELIEELRDRGVTLLVAEQNVEKALQVADRAYVLGTGRVVLHDTAEALRQNPHIERAYLGLGVETEL